MILKLKGNERERRRMAAAAAAATSGTGAAPTSRTAAAPTSGTAAAGGSGGAAAAGSSGGTPAGPRVRGVPEQRESELTRRWLVSEVSFSFSKCDCRRPYFLYISKLFELYVPSQRWIFALANDQITLSDRLKRP